MIYRFFYFLLFIGLMASGCTEPVYVLPATDEKLIVQAEFTVGEDLDLYIFKGVGIPLEGEVPVIPADLEMKVLHEGVELNVHRVDNTIPFFRVDLASIASGQTVELRAEIPGEDKIRKVKARTIIPQQDEILNLKAIVDTIASTGNNFKVSVNLDFDISSNNYDRFYELSIINEASGTLMPPVDTLWHPLPGPQPYLSINDSALPAGIYHVKSRNSILIDHFKLGKNHIELNMQMESILLGDFSQLRLILKSHTRDGFEYIRSYDKFQADYYAEFPILVSNIEDGIGIFTACAKSEKIIKLKNR